MTKNKDTPLGVKVVDTKDGKKLYKVLDDGIIALISDEERQLILQEAIELLKRRGEDVSMYDYYT